MAIALSRDPLLASTESCVLEGESVVPAALTLNLPGVDPGGNDCFSEA
jgi:hypothetical protein